MSDDLGSLRRKIGDSKRIRSIQGKKPSEDFVTLQFFGLNACHKMSGSWSRRWHKQCDMIDVPKERSTKSFLKSCLIHMILLTYVTTRCHFLFQHGFIHILFQFCKAAPEDLPICDPLDRTPSYISYQYYDRIHGLKMLLQDKMKCVCPNGYNYLDTRYNFVTKGSFDVAMIKYFCLPVSYATANFRFCTWTLIFCKKPKNSKGQLKYFL